MKVLAIIAEYNPMHLGHIYHIEKAKEMVNPDYTILLLSGSFTQNGNISCINKFTKAQIALCYEVDMVLELPAIYSCSSAQYFAHSAVSILHHLGIITHLCFGAECSQISTLRHIAITLLEQDQNVWNGISSSCSKQNFASIRNEVLKNYLTDKQLKEIAKPNNILGIEYIKSLLSLHSTIEPVIIKRKGTISSRKIRSSNDTTYLKQNTPKEVYQYFETHPFQTNKDMYSILRYKILLHTKESLKNIHEVTEGLENRIIACAIYSTSYEKFIQEVKSKRYLESKIKRIAINILLDITKEMFENSYNMKYYASVLNFSEKGRKLLSLIHEHSSIPIVTDKKSIPSNMEQLVELDRKASNIHSILACDFLNLDDTQKKGP